MTVRVVLADDQRVVRDGLVLLLDLLPDIDLVGTAQDGVQALQRVAELQPDVVLRDLRMPRMDGVEATRRIRDAHPLVHVIVLTTYADGQSVFGALRAGARLLTKDAGADEIAHTVNVVATGQALLDSSVQARLLDSLDRIPSPANTAPDEAPAGLTNREVDVLRLIAAGLSNTEIAAHMFVTEATVKTHVNHIYAKTGVRDRAQAVSDTPTAAGWRHRNQRCRRRLLPAPGGMATSSALIDRIAAAAEREPGRVGPVLKALLGEAFEVIDSTPCGWWPQWSEQSTV